VQLGLVLTGQDLRNFLVSVRGEAAGSRWRAGLRPAGGLVRPRSGLDAAGGEL